MVSLVKRILKVIDRELLIYADNWGEYRRNYLSVRLNIIIACLFFLQVGYSIYLSAYTSAILITIQAFLYLFFVYVFYTGKVLFGKNMTFLLTNIFVFISASLFGREQYQYLFLIPLLISSVFFYSDKEFRYMLAALSLAVINLIVLELTDYQLLKAWNSLYIVYWFNKFFVVIVSLGFSFYMLYELLTMNINMEEKLNRLNNNLLMRNAKLKASNDDLDSFVYRASHDLRSPLASIMGVINIVKAEKDVFKIKEYMKYQERSIKKLDDLIQDILDLSRNAQLDLSMETVNLKHLVKNCVDSFSYMDEFEKLDIQLLIDDNFIMHTDVRRLKVIVNNLLSNALHYYDKEKAQPYLNIRAEIIGNDFVIIFQDNGIGIHSDHLDRVFEMFYRATDQNTGSGLGLYIVKDAIDKLNGVIKLDSVLYKGTTIQMHIPKSDILNNETAVS